MNRDELFEISEEATDIQCKLRGIYELLEVLQTAEERNQIPYPDALFQIQKMVEALLDQATAFAKSLSDKKIQEHMNSKTEI